jgi:pSer/pThr/pTyr-binding forkhead associated (FHA) protein
MEVWLLLLRLFLAGALYLFLGTLLFFLWRDLVRPKENMVVPQRRYGQLRVVDVAPEQEETGGVLAPGTTFSLQPVTSLGRAVTNSITIPDAYASSEHALLIYRAGQWWLEDRGSRNGTLLNMVAVDGPTVVSAGDIIGIGRVHLKLELAED